MYVVQRAAVLSILSDEGVKSARGGEYRGGGRHDDRSISGGEVLRRSIVVHPDGVSVLAAASAFAKLRSFHVRVGARIGIDLAPRIARSRKRSEDLKTLGLVKIG